MKKIYITSKYLSVAKEVLSKKFKVDINKKSFLKKKGLIEVVKEYDAILTSIYDKLDSSVLSYIKKLKVISNYAVGLDNIDVEYANKKGVTVFNLPHIVTNSTADLAFSLLLSLSRNICSAKEYVKKGLWTGFDSNKFMGEELFSKTLGIIGFGRIGKAVARRALGFGLKVIFFKRKKEELEESLRKCLRVSLDNLLEKSDFICLCVPLTSKTENMIDLEKIKKMKKKPFLINIARGKVIKTDDLVIALKNNLLRGVALDVVNPEPISFDHPLLSFENCLIVPHIGTATFSCRYNMSQKAAENILKFFIKNN